MLEHDDIILKKRGRGRPRKITFTEEILKLVDEVKEKEDLEIKEIVEEVKQQHKGEWDIPLDQEVNFFDARLSYEITGYKPINDKLGLDFNPDWFTESRENFKRTGHYTAFRKGTKAYTDFWTKEYIRCREGMTVNGYTITGDNYFFLNYYQLANLQTSKLGEGRLMDFPTFYVALYEWFHYLELAKRLRKNAVLMKARGVGFSEMDASLAVNTYNCRRNSNVIIAANQGNYTEDTCNKAWNAMSFINDYTDGGFFKLRQVLDKADRKKASYYKVINGLKVESGWMSQIIGIVADKPNKIRGQRCDILLYEELGSWKDSMTAFIQGDALVGIQGMRFGIKIGGGTGGDSGAALDGLRNMYYDPESYDILPYRHNYSLTGEEVITAYFIPTTVIVKEPGYMDERGYTNPEKGKEYYDAERLKKASNPLLLVKYSAEYCYNAEEAFALEGDNKFNKINIAELLTAIRALKQCPDIENGCFRFQFKGTNHKVNSENVTDVIWRKVAQGKVRILEHPLWTIDSENLENQDNEKIPITNNLYVAGIDGIDIGAALTSDLTKDPSDFCMVVKRRTFGLKEPLYVAIYKDRPSDIREAYETAIALAMYYNCKINIEATRMSMVTWARDRSLLNFFMKRPSATYPDMSRRKSTLYGSPASVAVIEHLTDLISDFVNDYCHTIWFEDMLDELNRYTDENKRKFDIIAAFGECELADEELSGVVPRAVKSEDDVFEDFGYYYDEYGHKRYGTIPKKVTFETNFKPYAESRYDNTRTSNPRYYM